MLDKKKKKVSQIMSCCISRNVAWIYTFSNVHMV